jgi:catechol 2,3-dioxygenase-like lactoylglutathione lyase family enzyme
VTRELHVGFRAHDRGQVDALWQAGIDAGYRDDGAPRPRTQYGPTYYGAFLLDPGGNSVEAVHVDCEDAVPDGRIDHPWIRVHDFEPSRRFYATLAPHAGRGKPPGHHPAHSLYLTQVFGRNKGTIAARRA